MLVQSNYLLWGFGLLGIATIAFFALFIERKFRNRVNAYVAKLLPTMALLIGVAVWGSQWAIGTTIFIVDNATNCPKMRLIGSVNYKFANGDSIMLSDHVSSQEIGGRVYNHLVLNNLDLPLGVTRIYYRNQRFKQDVPIPEGSSEMLTMLISPYSLGLTESIDFALGTPPETVEMKPEDNVIEKQWLHFEPEMKLMTFRAFDRSFSIHVPVAYRYETDGGTIDSFFAADSTTTIRIFHNRKVPYTDTENMAKYVNSYMKQMLKKHWTLYSRQNDPVCSSISEIDGRPAQLYGLAKQTDYDHNCLAFVETDTTIYMIHIESYRYRMSDLINMITRSFKIGI